MTKAFSTIALAVVVAALVTGCGVGGTSTVTITHNKTVTAPTGSPTSEPPAPDPRIAQLQVFLLEFKGESERINLLNGQIGSAVETYNSNKNLQQLGATLMPIVSKLDRIDTRLATLGPPTSIGAAFTTYVDALGTNDELISAGASRAANGDESGLIHARDNMNTRAAVHLKTVLTMQLSHFGLRVPRWVTQIS